MTKLILSQIINDWDPVGIIAFSPRDEYLPEINKIEKYLQACDKADVQSLANEIKGIFADSFGVNVFTRQIDECENIAKKILKIKRQTNNKEL